MIIDLDSDNKRKDPSGHAENSTVNEPVASGSDPAPPFQGDDHDHQLGDLKLTERSHLLVDFPEQTELGPPPDFAPYEAEHFEVGYNDVVSHDAHLNSDGEALYRFLLSQSELRPSYRLHCSGTHDEMRNRWVTERDSHGRSRTRQETYSESVIDFDFRIDILPEMPISHEPIHWSVADDEPAYRGKMVREYELSPSPEVNTENGKRTATRKEVKGYKNWLKKRIASGFPPWVRQEDTENGVLDPSTLPRMDALRSSKTLRQWADEYCASPKYLKEFVYEKVLYGWNIQQLEIAVRSAIKSAPYSGRLTVEFSPRGTKVYVRPDNKVSRMLSNKWLKILSIILLIFPFIWLFKRFHSRGGGRWEVCGGAYVLKQWVPLEPGEETEMEAELPAAAEQLPAYSSMSSGLGLGSALTTASGSIRNSRRYMQTPTGPRKLVGLKEGEWFRQWEGIITRAVISGYRSPNPLLPSVRSAPEVQLLDGYNEAPSLIEY